MNAIQKAKSAKVKQSNVETMVQMIIDIDSMLYEESCIRFICGEAAKKVRAEYSYNQGKPEMEAVEMLLRELEARNLRTTNGNDRMTKEAL